MKRLILILIALALPVAITAEDKPKSTKEEAMSFILDKAKEYTEKGEAAISKAVDLAMKETPKIVREFLAWRFWKHLIYGFVPIAVLASCLIVGVILIWIAEKFDLEELAFIPISILSVIALISLLVFFADGIANLMSALQIHMAPRIYLIEEAAKLF